MYMYIRTADCRIYIRLALYIYIPLNRRHPPPPPVLEVRGNCSECGTNCIYIYISRFGIKTRGVCIYIYRPTRINDTRARPYVVPEKNTLRKTVTLFSPPSLSLLWCFFFFFLISRDARV